METPNTDSTIDTEEIPDDLAKLKEALRKERENHKDTRGKLKGLRAKVTTSVGLAEDAADDAITASLVNVETAVTQRTTTIAAERDAAKGEAAKVASEWDAHRIEQAIRATLAESNILADCVDDALEKMKPLFIVKDGKIITRSDAANTLPGVEPKQYVFGSLRALKPRWWPTSLGGGARGSSTTSFAPPGDSSVFNPASSNYSIGGQANYESRYGIGNARKAAQQYGRKLVGE